MCSLFSSLLPPAALVRLFKIDGPVPNLPPFEEVWPGRDAPVIVAGQDGRRLEQMSWGFLLERKGYAPKRVFNARDDKLSGFFWRRSFETRRCLVPATAFAEPDPQEKWRKKHWFSVKGAEGFALAGLWRPWQGVLKGETVSLQVFAFVTTRANAVVRPVHPTRMPVLLDPNDQAVWLSGPVAAAQDLIRPYPAEAMAHRVETADQPKLL